MFISNDLYNDYNNYKISDLVSKRFSYEEMQGYLDSLIDGTKFSKKQIGKSLEGRQINLYSIGNGPLNVLGWSQMHGDESTATMALMDMLNFLRSNDKFDDFRNTLFDKLTIHFLPMLNPDGAERFQRRNALDIDLNRDALRLQYPESQALKSVQDSLKPVFGFNLHDQDLRYTVGKTYKSATISFLAPAFNHAKDINEIRGNAMKVIVNMHDELSKFIPGHIARYDDEFEPRAFGDNFVKWGTGTILIESGGWKNNFEKQFLRKLNFVGILVGLQSMAEKQYETANLDTYWNIPENRKYLFDVLLRNVSREYNSKQYIMDIGVNHKEVATLTNRDDYYFGVIDDLGDLSTFYGFDEYDCTDMIAEDGKIYPEIFENVSELENLKFPELYEQGYTTVCVKNIDKDMKYSSYPINICTESSGYKSELSLNNPADFVIKEGGKIRFTIINGFVYDNASGKSSILNGNIFR